MRLGGIVGYTTRGDVVACHSAYSTIGDTSLQAEAVGGIVGYNNKAYIYGRYSTHVGFNGSVIGDESGIGSIAGYTSRHVTSCHIVQPYEMTGIKPICKSIYTPDLNTSDNSVWKVQ